MLMMTDLDVSDDKERLGISTECGVNILHYEEAAGVSEKCGTAAGDCSLDANVTCTANKLEQAQHGPVAAQPRLGGLVAGAPCARGTAVARLARFRAPPSITSRLAGVSTTPQHCDSVTLQQDYSTNIDSGKHCFCL